MPAALTSLSGDGLVDAAHKRMLGVFGDQPYRTGSSGVPLREINPSVVPGGPPGATAPPPTGGGGGGGPGVGTYPVGGAVPRWATWAPAVPRDIASITREAMQGHELSPDPQLPSGHPLGAYTDSQYEAENAVLEQQINAAYADILYQTGYDVEGKHFPGEVEMMAARKERDYLTGLNNAGEEVTGQMQQAGTIFSGYHANQRAKAEQPFITGLGDLAIDTPKTLARLVEQAGDLMREYIVNRNMLLMQAAQRQAYLQALQKAQAAGADTPEPPVQTSPYNPAEIVPDLTWLNPTVTNDPAINATGAEGPGAWYGGDYQHPRKKKPGQNDGIPGAYHVGGKI